ncbi:Cysteine/serine-rich nuclear protein 2 [Pseudolycoriella hygida]|uniref:Cysteine/serine-rich nuclear protein 2 n=1 Tax=Pseudolycoriella hygida TaxID=35572 RepID=A0A9Q0NDR1_9DIPT|nr:Cysteine/serine-rich nuclear protein 2 [Pseudolycoriella hygida]
MFKSILNSIQKNVIGATIFGKSTTMSATEEIIPSEPIPLIDVNEDPITLDSLNNSTEEADNTIDALAECEDPLCDPLALDDSSISTADVADNALAELKTSPDGQIILIDVNILRNVDQNELINGRDMQTEDLNETIEEGVPSDGSDSGVASDGSIIEVRPQMPEINTKRSCLKRRSTDLILNDNSKRTKRNIKFDGVNVFYFQRMQGNSCVPSQGGCTLGMAPHHMHNRTFSLAEHAAEQRRHHRLQDIRHTNTSSTDDTDTDYDPSENSGSDLDNETNGFLQPVAARQRRIMLKTAGVLKIDSNEKDDCRKIRTSREMCGCNCRGFCEPDTCFCSQSGIQCQVDRPNFPCGCTEHGCDNAAGRVEFDPERVRIHFIHTIVRLEIETKQNRPEENLFRNDVSRQWHPQTRPPDISGASSSSDHSNFHYNNSTVFDSLSHRSITAMTADSSMKNFDRVDQSLPSHSSSNNLIELANRQSDDDTLNLHYDYRNDGFSTESIINADVVSDIIEKGGANVGAANSFSSTFNEFIERTYNLGGTDYQNHHSAYLSSSHSEPTSSGIVDSSSIDNIPYDLCDEPIPNSTSMLENDAPYQSNPVDDIDLAIDSSERPIDDSVRADVITDLLNNDVDVEDEIPSVVVTIDNNKIGNNECKEISSESALVSPVLDFDSADKHELTNL